MKQIISYLKKIKLKPLVATVTSNPTSAQATQNKPQVQVPSKPVQPSASNQTSAQPVSQSPAQQAAGSNMAKPPQQVQPTQNTQIPVPVHETMGDKGGVLEEEAKKKEGFHSNVGEERKEEDNPFLQEKT